MALFRIDAPPPENTGSQVWASACAPRTNNGITIVLGQNVIEIETESPEHAEKVCAALAESFEQAADEYWEAKK